jgi:hypothetical protein
MELKPNIWKVIVSIIVSIIIGLLYLYKEYSGMVEILRSDAFLPNFFNFILSSDQIILFFITFIISLLLVYIIWSLIQKKK